MTVSTTITYFIPKLCRQQLVQCNWSVGLCVQYDDETV